ncbi:MAG: amidophosphoribosyltransferase, partial [Dehalococcoidia bacterium]|nr:amidophosphoribosyltransferase [Dehalococcoidia bacterium]
MHCHESCGIFGVYAPGEDVARLTFFGLFALQHRGQESSGIATADGRKIRVHTSMGLVSQVFDEDDLRYLQGGYVAIGHNRYSTSGSSQFVNAQPVVVNSHDGDIALGHNGNIVNAVHLRQDLLQRGYHFSGASDSEVIAVLISASPGTNWIEKIRYSIHHMSGVYSLVMLTPDGLIGVRDPLGVRPLCLGKINGGW